MKKGQRKALRKSIKHWRKNVERHARGEVMEIGAEYCACCEYANRKVPTGVEAGSCVACPIAEYTGESYCFKTPYYAVLRDKVPPAEMLDWLVELEAGGKPPLLSNKPYMF